MPICNARYLPGDEVFCQLERGHIQEHWSRFRNEDDPPEYVRAEIWWKNSEDAVNEETL